MFENSLLENKGHEPEPGLSNPPKTKSPKPWSTSQSEFSWANQFIFNNYFFRFKYKIQVDMVDLRYIEGRRLAEILKMTP